MVRYIAVTVARGNLAHYDKTAAVRPPPNGKNAFRPGAGSVNHGSVTKDVLVNCHYENVTQRRNQYERVYQPDDSYLGRNPEWRIEEEQDGQAN